MGDAWHVCSIAGYGNPGHLDGKRRICKVFYPSTTANPRRSLSTSLPPNSVSRLPFPLRVAKKQPLGQRYCPNMHLRSDELSLGHRSRPAGGHLDQRQAQP
jgi:hypothetical protein